MDPEHLKYMPRPAGENARIPEEDTKEEVKEEAAEFQSAPAEVKPSVIGLQKEEKKEVAEMELEKESYPFLRIIYAFFSPFLAPTIATWWIFSLSVLQIYHPGAGTPYAFTVFGATCIVPVIALLILLKVGAIKTVDILSPKERILPYFLQIVALGAVTFFFIYRGAPAWIWTVFCGAAAVGVVNLILNFFIRVSNHCSAMAGLLAVLLVINSHGMPIHPLMWWAVGVAACGGLAGAFAIIIGRHSVWDVFAGYATGFLCIILFSLIH